MPIKRKSRFNYYTDTKRPNYRRERRIKMPKITKRPLRFQLRSMIDYAFLQPPPHAGFTIHRRGVGGRPWIGVAPLEMRAISKEKIRGTLPERIIYKYLVDQMSMTEGIDFSFQSSLQGGRIDTGGIVADFLFYALRLVINPLGPTHDEFLRIKKDQEQIDALTSLGYQVYMIPEDDVYDEPTFIRKMKQIFGWVHSGAGDVSYHSSEYSNELEALLGMEMAIANI